MAEAGVPDMEVPVWTAFFAPAKTPPAIVARLQKEVARVVQTAEVRERFAADGPRPGRRLLRGPRPPRGARHREVDRRRQGGQHQERLANSGSGSQLVFAYAKTSCDPDPEFLALPVDEHERDARGRVRAVRPGMVGAALDQDVACRASAFRPRPSPPRSRPRARSRSRRSRCGACRDACRAGGRARHPCRCRRRSSRAGACSSPSSCGSGGKSMMRRMVPLASAAGCPGAFRSSPAQ